MKVKFLAAAEIEIDEAYAYYESQKTGLGPSFLDEILHIISNIKTYPKAWPKYSYRTRRCLASRFPYAVVYQLRENMILIIAVAHLHRKPVYWKERV